MVGEWWFYSQASERKDSYQACLLTKRQIKTFEEGHRHAQKYEVGKDVDSSIAKPLCFDVKAFGVTDAVPKVVDRPTEEQGGDDRPCSCSLYQHSLFSS